MHDSQGGHPTARQSRVEPVPIVVTLVTATAQALPPIAQGGAGEARHHRQVPRHGVVVVVT